MRISVLMSVHLASDPSYLNEALASLAAQSHCADEVVLVEDGVLSPQHYATIEAQREKLNILSVKLSGNVGLGAALKLGLDRCQGEFVARMDADDICLPHRFSFQLGAFLSDPDLDVLGSHAIEIDGDGALGAIRRVPSDHDAIIQTLWANPLVHPAVMFKRLKILQVGSYSERLRRRQDYDLWFRCAAAGLKFANIPEPLIKYRFTHQTHSRQSRRGAWRQGMIGFEGSRVLGLPLWKQLACFAPFARSLLPISMQHRAYRVMQKFDPRRS